MEQNQSRRPSRRKYHIIYKTTCLVTGRYYIGMHSTDDLEDGYLGSGVHLTRSVKKYGKDQHVREIIEHLPNRDLLKKREEELVTEDLVKNDVLCMNLIKGGGGNDRDYGITEKTRKLLSEASKRAVRTEEWKAKISAAHMGKTMPREAVEKQRTKMTGRVVPQEEQDRRTAAVRAARAKARRPIVVNGVTYESGHLASLATGIPAKTIYNRCVSQNFPEFYFVDSPKSLNRSQPGEEIEAL